MPMTIQQIRNQYPQYNSLSDKDLADKLYDKFYVGKITKPDFYKKMGISQKINPISKGFLPESPLNAIRDIGSGMASTAVGTLNLGEEIGHGIASALTGGYAPNPGSDYINHGLDPIVNYISPKNPTIGDKALQMAGQFMPVEALTGLASKTGSALSEVPEFLKSPLANTVSKVFKSNLSPEELANNLETTKGTNTSLGDVIGSPFLKKQYENVLAKIPGSGVEGKMLSVANEIQNRGKSILSKLIGSNSTENLGESLKNALKKSYQEAQKEKISNWNEVNNSADNSGVVISRDNLAKEAQDRLEEINESPELKRETSPGLIDDLESYANPENINTLKLSNIFKGKIGEKANKSYLSGNLHEYGIYRSLKDALGKDIDDSMAFQGDKELKSLYQKANDFHKTNIAPFDEPEIVKFIRHGGDPDTLLSTFIKTGINDRGNLLNKLVGKLSPDERGIPAYGFLSRAIENGQLNPLKMRSLYKSLGENQKKILMGTPGLKNEMENFSSLVDKNVEPLSIMSNPKTGNRNSDSIVPWAGISGLGAAGYAFGGAPGAVAASFGLPVFSKFLVKGLTSPSFREKVVNKLIENSK